MKKNQLKGNFLLLVFLLFSGMLFGQTVLYHEEFDGGLNGWQTIGYETDNAPTYDYANNLWSWEEDGASNGQLRILTIESESVSNGAALFDAESYQRAENNSGLPDGPPYPDFHTELISPEYDITSANIASVQWTQILSELINSSDEFPQASFAYRLDGGSWSEPIPIPGIEANGTEETETLTMHIPDVQGASTLQVKFIHFQSFYYWLIDDVKILSADPTSDLEISNIFVTPSYYMTPKDLIKYDTFYFHFETAQLGNVTSTTPQVEIIVSNKQTSDIVYSKIENLQPLLVTNGVSRDDSLTTSYAPGDLPVGTYNIEYKVSDPSLTESDPSDNSYSYDFKVTEELFGIGDEINGVPFTTRENNNKGFYVGVLFSFPENYTGEYVWEGFTTAYDIVGTPSSLDYNYTLYFTKTNGFCERNSHPPFANLNAPPEENGYFTVLGKTEFSTIDYPVAETFVVPLLDKDTGEPLTVEERTVEKGNCYVFWIKVPEESLDVGIATTYELYGPTNTDRNWRPTIYDVERQAYFIKGWDGKRTPAMQPSIKFNAVSDLPELPESSITVYPNPVSDIITADLNLDNATDVTVMIADMTGVIQSISVEKNVTQSTIQRNVSDLASGTYLFRIVTKDGARNTKFVKQ